MSRRIIGSVVGALAAASLVAPVAHAGSPARVSVRVEAPGRTLADATLTTSRTPVEPDGTHACSGTSAGGALAQATRDGWTGTWFDSLSDYAVSTIGGVRAPADFSAYWAFWINGRVSEKGVCGTELQAGDDVLEFLCTSSQGGSSCTNLPLELKVIRPSRASMSVRVVLLDGTGRSTPVKGATVTGGTRPVRTAADGSARVTLQQGQSLLRAVHAGDVPSNRLHCHHGPHDASCGTRDQTPPALQLAGIANGQTFAAGAGPRVLRGTASDPGGATVALRLTRRLGTQCSRFDANRGAFRPCSRAPHAPFQVGDRTRWSFLLPAKLGPGSYRLDAIATDADGNRRTLHVGFTVRARA